MQEFSNGNSIYTGGLRYIAADEPTSCVRCGHDEEKARALRLPPPTMPKPGYIHCPQCSPHEVYCAADHNPTHREEQRRIRAEIHEVFFEETQRGIKGSSSGSSGRRREKKPGEKFTIRIEQEWQGFANGNSAGDYSASITRIEKTDVHINLLVPVALRDELMSAARERATKASIVLREVFADHLGNLEKVTPHEKGAPKGRIRHCVSRGEKLHLERETQRHGCSLNELAAECLSEYFYRNP